MLNRIFKPRAVKVKPVFKEKIPYSDKALARLLKQLGVISLQYDEQSIRIFSCEEEDRRSVGSR